MFNDRFAEFMDYARTELYLLAINVAVSSFGLFIPLNRCVPALHT